MILQGNTLDLLPAIGPLPEALADGSVQTVITSPPYFGLRDYGVEGQIGLEPLPDCLGWASGNPCGHCFVCVMVSVFRGVRRVLRDDGTCWINLGDSYASNGGQTPMRGEQFKGSARAEANICISNRTKFLPPKNLIGMPWRVALALQADGWILRQEIIWSKPNPMPESCKDRCTKSHEHLFLFSKKSSYYWDFEAMQEPVSPNTHARLAQNVAAQKGSDRAHAGGKTNGPMKAVGRKSIPAGWDSGQDRSHRDMSGNFTKKRKLYTGNGVGFGHGYDAESRARGRVKNNPSAAMAEVVTERNKRSVWAISTEACKEAHFATYPQALVETCMLASTRPSDLVLDPFLGAGTTAMVAERFSRRWAGIELNPDYIVIAERRIGNVQPGLPLSFAPQDAA